MAALVPNYTLLLVLGSDQCHKCNQGQKAQSNLETLSVLAKRRQLHIVIALVQVTGVEMTTAYFPRSLTQLESVAYD